MPSIPSNNTNATVYAIAERAAERMEGERAAAGPRRASLIRRTWARPAVHSRRDVGHLIAAFEPSGS
jgi:choline dehydrogenase-like flavoprotein